MAFRIVQRHEDLFWIFHGDRKVANLFPARPSLEWPAGVRLFIAEPWSIIPDPEAFPDPSCTGLPLPLSPAGNRFDSFEQVLGFLSIEQECVAA